MFENVISLGFFCGVAQETERLGLRSSSMPLDWVISTSFAKVLELIEEDFVGYIENLHFYDETSNRVDNDEYFIQFFHDFSRKKSLEEQVPYVVQKYKKRVKGFCEAVKKPTLFIRYILDDNEYEWIINNSDYIDSIIKKNNSENQIVFIGHHRLTPEFKHVYYQVLPDENDVVARKFTKKNKECLIFLQDNELFNSQQRKKNIRFYYWGRFKKWLHKFPDKARMLTGRRN